MSKYWQVRGNPAGIAYELLIRFGMKYRTSVRGPISFPMQGTLATGYVCPIRPFDTNHL